MTRREINKRHDAVRRAHRAVFALRIDRMELEELHDFAERDSTTVTRLIRDFITWGLEDAARRAKGM